MSTAVSYTHLDVYKRQGANRSRLSHRQGMCSVMSLSFIEAARAEGLASEHAEDSQCAGAYEAAG